MASHPYVHYDRRNIPWKKKDTHESKNDFLPIVEGVPEYVIMTKGR